VITSPVACPGMTLNCIHIFIITGSFLYDVLAGQSDQRFFIHNCIDLRIWIISSLATFPGTKSLCADVP